MKIQQSLLGSSAKKVKIISRTVRTAWRLRRAVLVGYFSGAILEIVGSLVTIYATAQLGNLLARYIAGKPTSKIWFWLAVDVLATTLIGIGFWLMSYYERLTYFTVSQWSINKYMQQLCDIDYPDHYDRDVRNLLNKVDSGFSWNMANLTAFSLELCYGILRFAAITVVVAQISWWLIPAIVVFLLPGLVAEGRMAQLVWWVWDEKGDQRHVFWNLFHIFKQARAQMEIRSLQAKNYLTNKIRHMNSSFFQTQERKYRSASKHVVLAKIFEAGGVVMGSIILIRRFLAGNIGFDRYLFLSGALLRISGALNAVFGTLTRMQEPLLYAETFYEFIDRPARMVDKPAAIKLKDKGSPGVIFDKVSFSYPGSSKPIFDGLSLNIKPGEHVAIVGENGAGKSTLIKLLMRFYSPTSGNIKVDGHDLNDVAIESWYSRLATLFQDFNRYPFSVRENIEMIDDPSKVSQSRLQKAIKLGGVDSIVKELPKGYDTVLDSSFKDGIEPSGGQYQRVALARAFYRDASLLILDEPTASIDAKAEYEIFNNIFEEYKNKSVIIISHRFSTVRRADRIVVLDKGQIVEEGSHEKLMEKNGLYKEMFTKQAEGYK